MGNNQRKLTGIQTNMILIGLVIVLAVVPLIMVKDSEFSGADEKAENAVKEIREDYQPWFTSIFKVPGEETESLLFALQAAVGAGILGYGLGYMRGRRRKEDKK